MRNDADICICCRRRKEKYCEKRKKGFLLDSETNVLSELRNTQRWISTGGTDGIRVRSLPDDVCAQLQEPSSGFAADYHTERNGPPDIVRCPKAACYLKTEYGERRIMPG